MATLGSFAAKMRAYAADIPRQQNEIKKAAALEFLLTVVPATPVKSGLARSNWMAGVGSTPSGTRSTLDRNGDVSIRSARAVISSARPGQTIHIANNLVYMPLLNAGSSKQAPAGFVEKARAEAEALIARQVIRFQGKKL